jgi:APA family basic amino acid/polyamine antiporter
MRFFLLLLPQKRALAKQHYEKHESGLVRRLGLGAAFLLVISAMVGSGVFKKVAPMSAELGSPLWVLAAWLVAGLISWFGAMTNAEIASQIAEPGGQYVYFKKIFGRPLAFFYGWTAFTVVQSATAAGVAYVFAESVNALFGLPDLGIFIDNAAVKFLSIGVIWLVTLVNLQGVHYGERLSNVFTSIVIFCILSIIVLCFGWGNGDWMHFQVTASDVGKTVTVSSFFLAMLAAFWAYEGWNNIGFLSAEIKNPHRNVPLALTLGVAFVILVYLSINAAYLYVLPVQDFIRINAEENTISGVAVIQSFLGPVGSTLIASAIMVATFGTTNNTLMTASRVYFSMARDGLFFKRVAHCNPKTDVPSYALIYQAVWASMLVLSGSFDQLTDMLIFAAFIFYGTGAYGVFILRKRNQGKKADFQVPFFPILPAVFICFCAVLVINSLIERPLECGMGLCLMATGIPFYLYWERKKG